MASRMPHKHKTPFKSGDSNQFWLKPSVVAKFNQKEISMDKVKGFAANQAAIAKKEGVSSAAAGAILASATRKASPAAKKANPALKRVK